MASRIYHKLCIPFEIDHHRRELHGIKGGEIRTTNFQILIGTAFDISGNKEYPIKLKEFVDSLPAVITLEDYNSNLSKKVKEFKDRFVIVIDHTRSPEEEIQHNRDINQIHENNKQKQLEKKQKIEEFAIKSKKDYSNLIQISERGNLSTHALVGKNIRRELKDKFPGHKFSVKTEIYSGGSSVRVEWNDGLTEQMIYDVIKKYQEGSFNGMIDMYEYNDNDFHKIYGGVRYAFANRHYSREVYLRAIIDSGAKGEVKDAIGDYPYFDAIDNDTGVAWATYTRSDMYKLGIGWLKNLQDGWGHWTNSNQNAVVNRVTLTKYLADLNLYKKPKISKQASICKIDGVQVIHNENKNGIEIKFPSKPDFSIIQNLKEHGFRWSRFNKCWWKKYNKDDYTFAMTIST